jgi:hypothetical protein
MPQVDGRTIIALSGKQEFFAESVRKTGFPPTAWIAPLSIGGITVFTMMPQSYDF